MPRQPRLHLPGALYHVMSRGIERRTIFRSDQDRTDFLARLAAGLSRIGYRCFAWTLMPNHFHLLLQSSETPLSDLMRSLMSGYAGSFNRRHHRRGILFQNRYKAILCQQDPYLLELIRYIHLNPLRAKLVPDLEGLGEYPWSGHARLCGQYKGSFQEVNDVLALFGRTRKKAAAAYSTFVAEGVGQGKRPEFTGGGLRRSAGGWVGVERLRRETEYWRGDDRILGDGNFVADMLQTFDEHMDPKETLRRQGWTLDQLARDICQRLAVDIATLREKGRANRLSQAKAALAYLGHTSLGLSRREIASYLGVSTPAITYIIRSGKTAVEEHGLMDIF